MTYATKCPYVFGIQPIKPIINPPAGRIKIRMRGSQFGFAIVRDETGHCRWAAIKDHGETWELDFNVGVPDGTAKLHRRIRELEEMNECLDKECKAWARAAIL